MIKKIINNIEFNTETEEFTKDGKVLRSIVLKNNNLSINKKYKVYDGKTNFVYTSVSPKEAPINNCSARSKFIKKLESNNQ